MFDKKIVVTTVCAFVYDDTKMRYMKMVLACYNLYVNMLYK